jgi:hypothetical protein
VRDEHQALLAAREMRERSEETEFYLRIETEENLARGMPYDEARASALRKLGNSP